MAALDDLLSRLKQLHPLSIDLSLGRIEQLLGRLGHPEQRLPPTIHIAGTNGKGSVTAYLKAMLEAAGRRTHAYTSPHLIRFNERIAVPDATGRCQPIPEADLVPLLERVEVINTGAPITFFEITTAAAFLAFAERPADALLLEVGLGGRLDTTNVIARPAVTIITSISMDHAERLGATVEKIAAEKAGIMKRGVVCVTARQPDAVLEVLEAKAARIDATLKVFGRDFEAFEQRGRLVYQSENRLLDLPLPALIGPHQIVNAGVAVAAALETHGLGLNERTIATGLTTVQWPARMQRLSSGPLPSLLKREDELWLDGGHNPAGGIALAQTLADLEERSPRPLWMICGMMGQKDVAGFLTPFRGLAQRLLTVPIPGAHETPFPPERLAELARSLGLDAEPAPDVEAALKRIRAAAKGPARVLICGSLYLAGHVLALQQGVTPQTN
ncbi:MAG: bifunctional folylpolyglutamate synthase/dihydrofolate synthase [Hyphomicrobiaceae bacterium]